MTLPVPPVLTRDQRGLSNSVQYAVITPALMLVTLGIIQVGIWMHGHNVALRAAQAGADAARGSYGSVAQAHQVAQGIAEQSGLKRVSVTVSRSAAQVDVTVAADAQLIVELGLARVVETAAAPVERFTQP